MSDWSDGDRVDRYRIDAEIGSGSMGDVYRAFDLDLERPIALKILSERHRDNDELRARFIREARAVAKITHPNVVQVFSTGTYDGRPYIAMEMLRGIDLESIVDERGPWSSRPAARAILDACRGLEAAAAAGLIHRDVKPSNLVLLEDGVVKVTDFGLAKPLDPSREPALTAQGIVVGTPDYIAPEQARGEAIDERVDIYALGGTLYFLLTGQQPFRSGEPNEDKYLKVVARHLKLPAPDPRAMRPEVDGELAALSRAMMAKHPGDRPSYSRVASSLADIVRRLPAGQREPAAPSDKASARPVTAPTPYVVGKQRPPAGSAAPAQPGASPSPAPSPEASPRREPALSARIESAPPAAAGSDPAESAPPRSPDPERTARRRSRLIVVVAALLVAAIAIGAGIGLGLRESPRSASASGSGRADAGTDRTDSAP